MRGCGDIELSSVGCGLHPERDAGQELVPRGPAWWAQRDVGLAGSRAAGGRVSPPDGRSPVPTMAQGMTVSNGPPGSGPRANVGPTGDLWP